MRSTSPTKLVLDYSALETETEASSTYASFAQTEPLKLPSAASYGEVYAAASRRAGRLNAAGISEVEHKALLLERQLLLDKKLSGSITKKDSSRLEYVRWSLDRIEDAKFGASMDMIEQSISGYEQFARDVQMLQTQINDLQKHDRK